MRKSSIAAAAMLVLGPATAVAPAAQAAGAQHVTMAEEFDGSEHFAAGEQSCVAWAGTFHEVRHGGYDIVVAPGGRVPGESHVNGAVDGYVELVPDDPANPTYAGTYREKVNGIFLGTDDEGDDVLRIGQFRLVTLLHGSDGSTLRLSTSGKVTMDATGRIVVDRYTLGCG